MTVSYAPTISTNWAVVALSVVHGRLLPTAGGESISSLKDPVRMSGRGGEGTQFALSTMCFNSRIQHGMNEERNILFMSPPQSRVFQQRITFKFQKIS